MPQENNSIPQTPIKRSSDTPEAKAEQLREDIARTRSALSEDVKALTEKLKPEQLKEDAKEVIQHAGEVAREGAKHIVRDAKDAAVDSLRHAKDHAFESISESGRHIGMVARRAGHDVSEFVAVNALPLALLGAGAGWLMISMSHQRRLQRGYAAYERGDEPSYGPSREYRGREGVEGAWNSARERTGELTSRAAGAISDGRERLRERAHELSTNVSERVGELRSQVSEGATHLGHEAVELGHRAYDGIQWAGQRAVQVSERNPLAIGLLAFGAGAAVAMLLPPTRRENELMGQTRDRLVHKAQESASELKSSLQRGADDVREAMNELRQTGQHA